MTLPDCFEEKIIWDEEAQKILSQGVVSLEEGTDAIAMVRYYRMKCKEYIAKELEDE